MARCVLEHLPLYFFRVPPSTCSVGTYLASQSSHLNLFLCCCTCRRVFPFFLQNSHVCSFSFCFCGPIFVQKYHVRACCCRASLIPGIAAPQALHSTSQTAHSAESQVRAHQRATTQASRRLKSENIVEHLYSTLRSQNEEMAICIFRKPIQLHTHR